MSSSDNRRLRRVSVPVVCSRKSSSGSRFRVYRTVRNAVYVLNIFPASRFRKFPQLVVPFRRGENETCVAPYAACKNTYPVGTRYGLIRASYGAIPIVIHAYAVPKVCKYDPVVRRKSNSFICSRRYNLETAKTTVSRERFVIVDVVFSCVPARTSSSFRGEPDDEFVIVRTSSFLPACFTVTLCVACFARDR